MADADPKTTTQPPKDPELAAAEREALLAKARKEKAEAEKSIAEAQRDKMKAELTPLGDQSKITAPSGDVTTDQAGFVETQMLAQEAARAVAERLARELPRAREGATTLIIYSGPEIASLSALALTLDQLEQLRREYEAKAEESRRALGEANLRLKTTADLPQLEAAAFAAVLAAPAVATGIVKSVAELVNLFRTTVEFKNKAVTVTEDMVVSYLFKSLSETGRGEFVVYYPAFFPPNITASSDGTGFVDVLNRIRESRLAALTNISELEAMAALLTTEIEAAESGSDAKRQDAENKTAELGAMAETDPGRAALEAEIEQLRVQSSRLETRAGRLESALNTVDDAKTNLQSLNAAAEQVTLSLETPDATTKLTPLSQLVRSERLASIMKGDGAFTLRLNVTANGTTMIRKNLFLSARVQHSAGVSLIYQLFDQGGRIVTADGMQFYFEFQTGKEVRQLVNRTQETTQEPRQVRGVASRTVNPESGT